MQWRDPSILKRKRSRPSDWWAVGAISNAAGPPLQQNEPTPKTRGRRLIFDAERGIQEAPAAGNRGTRRKSVATEDDADGEIAKPLRKVRQSNTEAELVAAAEMVVVENWAANKKDHGGPAQSVMKDSGTVAKSVKRGRSSNAGAALRAAAEAALENDGAPIEKHWSLRQRREEIVKSTARPLRGGRSSYTERDLGAARKETVYAAVVPKTERVRSVDADAEEDELGIEPVEAATESKEEQGRPAVSKEREKLVDEVAEALSVPKKRGKLAAKGEDLQNMEVSTGGQADGERRGRHSMPWTEDPQTALLEIDEIAEAISALRRGRYSDTYDELRTVADIATKSQADAKRRGRRPKTSEEASTAIEDPPAANKAAVKPPRRGRSSNTETEVRVNVESSPRIKHSEQTRSEGKDGCQRPSGCCRICQGRGKKHTPHSDAEAVESTPTNSIQDKDRPKRRPRQSDVELEESAASGSVDKDVARRTARGRRSGTLIEIEAATSSLARDRSVRKQRGNISRSTHIKDWKPSSAEQAPSKSKRRAHQPVADAQESNEVQSRGKNSKRSARADAKRKRNAIEEQNEDRPESKRHRVETESQQDLNPQTEKQPTYQHLAAVTRRVSLQTIKTKWEALPPGCIERISQLLQDLQNPVLVPINDERKRADANKVMQMVSRRLLSKISKGLPFPCGTRKQREDDFDFEKILDHIRTLESQLTPAIHANELLESELIKGIALLESEEAVLAELETNAKTEATVRKAAGRKLHSLLLSNDTIVDQNRLNHCIGSGEHHSILPFTYAEDEDLQEISKELSGHLDTIQGNISRVEGISRAMAKSRAAVQATLCDYLETNQIEDIILG